MVEIGIWGEENIKDFFWKIENNYLKIIEKQIFFLNIFLYIINITYIDINNKLKIKPKLKHKTKLWFENRKPNVGMKIK